jgi:hypothetical protein
MSPVVDQAAVVDGEMLPEIPKALTRYSVNDPKFPVNDRRCSPGRSGTLCCLHDLATFSVGRAGIGLGVRG